MKIRVFKNMCNSVLRIVINTEDFSQDDIRLMRQFGEPEVNVGGFEYPNVAEKTQGGLGSEESPGVDPYVKFGDEYVRIMHGFPYARGFDMRDYDGASESDVMDIAESWKQYVVDGIEDEMSSLRSKSNSLPTEEVINF